MAYRVRKYRKPMRRRPMRRKSYGAKTKAKIAGRNTARKIFRAMRRKSKRSVAKIFSNFAGKVAYKKVSTMRKKRRY